MRDIPMLYSAPMVRALWNDWKTQTRRLGFDVPPQPEADCHPRNKPRHPAPYLDSYCSERKTSANPRGMSVNWCWWQVDDRQCLPTFKLKAKPGDRIWVRETWKPTGLTAFNKPSETRICGRFAYQADEQQERRDEMIPWRPSIHMPRWASRMTLIVTDVRVERLQDISAADAIAEGIERHGSGWMPYSTAFLQSDGVTPANYHQDPRESYRSLWNKINGTGAWETNPWVAAYTFRVIKQNIDRVQA
ncbi:hypothetical protein IB276_10910 [Ensifer sp. ENS04]|uniref:hypothetical protein n=1 Tax=Ensifer sp. ENS04 TaxID=2769281 RepID=UPI0017806137|nr:hypothetical protein [Ensifer sp. ENS04]MBD9539961.1 hypothetical protein [Ensifer sp. ENS04]